MTREEKLKLLNRLLEIEEKNDIGNLTTTERREFQQWFEVLEQEPCEKTQMVDKSTFSQEQYRADLQNAFDCGKASADCEDAISRHDAIRLVDELKDDLPDDEQMADIVTAHNEGISEYQTKLSLLPSVTPKQKMGRWLAVENEDMHTVDYFCSECDLPLETEERTPFCPNCGKKMREVDK